MNKHFWLAVGALQTLVATLGSLYFSLIKHWDPCVLCWYQRICMYPLVVLLGVAWITKDYKIGRYAWPLVIIGWGFALYHNLLRWGILPETCPATGPSCLQGTPWFGFITLPLLSLVAFTVIAFCLWMMGRAEENRSWGQ